MLNEFQLAKRIAGEKIDEIYHGIRNVMDDIPEYKEDILRAYASQMAQHVFNVKDVVNKFHTADNESSVEPTETPSESFAPEVPSIPEPAPISADASLNLPSTTA